MVHSRTRPLSFFSVSFQNYRSGPQNFSALWKNKIKQATAISFQYLCVKLTGRHQFQNHSWIGNIRASVSIIAHSFTDLGVLTSDVICNAWFILSRIKLMLNEDDLKYQYRSIGLVKFARNKNCSSVKINNHRKCFKYGRRYRYTLKIRGHFSYVLYKIEGAWSLLIGWRTVSKQRFSIILAKNRVWMCLNTNL